MIRSALFLLVSSLSLAQAPAAQDPGNVPLAEVDRMAFGPVDRIALAKEDDERAAAFEPWRFAVPHDVSVNPEQRGTWESLATGELLWRLRVAGEDAHSLNLGFTEFELPSSASLIVRASDGSARIRPFTAADNEEHGELWTPVLLADEVVVELRLAPEQYDDFRLTLGRVGQGYRGFESSVKSGTSALLSGSCNVDVVCPEGDAWGLEIPAVGALQINGFFNCTGAMLNDALDSLTPYFLTANHCGVSPGSAASLVIYWNYENSFCRPAFSPASGGPGDGILTQFTTGSQHRASYAPSDFTLVELDDDPDPAWKVSYAGWTRSSANPNGVTAIHHPGVEEKRISFEFDPLSTTSYLSDTPGGDGTHLRIEDWDVGTTEGGSSGSPIFDADHRVVGQLHGGFASCTSQTPDWYGRFSVSWDGGGTPSTRLSDWLDPLGTGVVAVDTISLDTLCSQAGTAEFLTPAAACSSAVSVRVVDCDLDLNETQVETTFALVTSTSEPTGESVLLTETTPGSARFDGSLPVSTTNAPGVLLVAPGDVLTLTYLDANDGQGGTNLLVTDTIGVDCAAPGVTGVLVSSVAHTTATIEVSADEPVSVVVNAGPTCGAVSVSGASSGDAATTQVVELSGLAVGTAYAFSVEVTDAAGNVTFADNGGNCWSFTTPDAVPYFTEQYLSDFDLDGRSVTFTPAAFPDSYAACVETIAALPTNPTGGAQLALSDDGSELVALTGGQTVTLYGNAWSEVYVGANGYVTFGESDGDYDESLEDHFDLSRVAALYDDLDPSSGGSVSVKQTANRLAVTWSGVPQYSSDDSNTFQIELFFDGRIRLSWLGVDSTDSIVGLSFGAGIQPDFFETDLGAAANCSGLVCQTDLGFGGPGTAQLSVCGGDLSTGTGADMKLISAAPSSIAYLFLSAASNPAPVFGGTLVPSVGHFAVPFVTSPAGRILVPGLPGGGGPFSLYAQFIIADASQALGFAFSNAVQLDFLP